MRIVVVDVRNFKRIDHIQISPDADQHLLLIAGNNGQGKSSLLDALTVAFGGKSALPPDPVRHGENGAQIVVELDDADNSRYIVRRAVAPDGGQKLEIRGPEGVIRQPQTWLDRLVGDRFLDPLSFLQADAKEQRRLLLAVAGVDTATLDGDRQRAYDKRTEVGRTLRQAQAEYDRIPAPTSPPPEARPVAMVTAELAEVETSYRQLGQVRANAMTARQNVTTKQREVDRLAAEIERLQAAKADAVQAVELAEVAARAAEGQARELASADRDAALVARRGELQAEAQRSETAARWQAAAQVTERRRAEADRTINSLTEQVKNLTTEIETIDQRKADMLAAATFPVDGLAFDDAGVQLGGVPFEQASQAERLRCALAVSMKLSPNIRDVWVRDGSLLDDASLEILRQSGEANGCRVWVERVGERDHNAVIIRDGRIVHPAAVDAAGNAVPGPALG